MAAADAALTANARISSLQAQLHVREDRLAEDRKNELDIQRMKQNIKNLETERHTLLRLADRFNFGPPFFLIWVNPENSHQPARHVTLSHRRRSPARPSAHRFLMPASVDPVAVAFHFCLGSPKFFPFVFFF